MKRVRLCPIGALALSTWLGCGDADPPGDTSAGQSDAGDRNAAEGGMIAIDGDRPPGCAPGTQYVWLLDRKGVLHKFDPPSFTLTPVGPIDCAPAEDGSTAQPFSMAVDRQGKAWVVFDDGRLYQIDTSNASCTPTSFVPNQSAFSTFGMGFSTRGIDSTTDELFVTQDSLDPAVKLQGLARIDTNTLELTPVAQYDTLAEQEAELTGTGDGRLFGFFTGQPFVVAEIDKATAKIVSQAPQPLIQLPPRAANFAFAHWGGDFYMFAGVALYTDVYRYRPSTNTTTLERSYSQLIVGAGVSTCAPFQPPR
jgi:hypothetical protein